MPDDGRIAINLPELFILYITGVTAFIYIDNGKSPDKAIALLSALQHHQACACNSCTLYRGTLKTARALDFCTLSFQTKSALQMLGLNYSRCPKFYHLKTARALHVCTLSFQTKNALEMLGLKYSRCCKFYHLNLRKKLIASRMAYAQIPFIHSSTTFIKTCIGQGTPC